MASVNLREKSLSDGTVSLVLDYHEFGIRYKKTLKIYANPQDAKSRNPVLREAYNEAYRIAYIEKNKVEKRLLHKENDIAPTYDRNASFVDYFDGLLAKHNHNWQNVANHLHRFTKGKLAMGNLTHEWISSFQDYLLTKVQPSTARSYIGLLIAGMRQAVRDKVMATNPGEDFQKVRAKEKPPKYLSKEQVELLLQNRQGIQGWLVQAFLFSCYTGLRLSDVETLTWAQVHGNGVNPEGRLNYKIVKEQVKTKDTVQIPLTTQAVAILEERGMRYKSASDGPARVFRIKSRAQVQRAMVRWSRQAGVHFTYHSSRHTFATSLQTAGVDIYTTSKLMGHRDINTTTKYARLETSLRTKAIEQLSSYLG